MTELLYQWMDLLWLPVALAAVHKGQRLKAVAFILVCIMTLRAQIELMQSIGHPNGLVGFMKSGAYERGLVVYGIIFALFLVLAYFSPNTRGIVFFAATLSIYIFAFCISMLVMAL